MTLIDDTCDNCGSRFDPMGDPLLTKHPEIGPYAVWCERCEPSTTDAWAMSAEPKEALTDMAERLRDAEIRLDEQRKMTDEAEARRDALADENARLRDALATIWALVEHRCGGCAHADYGCCDPTCSRTDCNVTTARLQGNIRVIISDLGGA